jgi:hypothetical protein
MRLGRFGKREHAIDQNLQLAVGDGVDPLALWANSTDVRCRRVRFAALRNLVLDVS